MKFLERLPTPLSIIDLVQRCASPHLELHARGECLGSLEGAFERAAVNRVEPHSVTRVCQLLRLKSSFLVQTNSGRAAPESLAQAVAGRMPDEKESRHAIAPAVCASSVVV